MTAKNIACSKSLSLSLYVPVPLLLVAFAHTLVHAEPLTVACQLTIYETARAEQSYANVCRTIRVCICTCDAFPREYSREKLAFSIFSHMLYSRLWCIPRLTVFESAVRLSVGGRTGAVDSRYPVLGSIVKRSANRAISCSRTGLETD